jgi:putative ABC transport system permease protein
LRDFEGNKRFTVIGVLPPTFRLAGKADLMMPLSESANYRSRNADWTPSLLIARLKPGIQPAQARAELTAMQRRLLPNNHEGAGGRRMVVLPLAEYFAQPVKTGLMILLCVVALVLLITCANVANLILSRDAGRLREIAVRTSLGAGRLRICRQLMTEALSLALAGGIAGLLFASWMVTGVKALAFARLPRIDEIGMDWRVLAFTAVISLTSGLLFGLAPALRLSRVDLAAAMKTGGAALTGDRHYQRMMSGLVVFEVALCAVALMSAGLLINTFFRLRGIDPGFRAERLLVASLSTQGMGRQSAIAFYDDVLAHVRSVPGVEEAGLTNYPPPYHVRSIQDFRRPEKSDAPGAGGPRANARVVSPGYFRTMGIRILRGRDFDAQDTANSRRAVIISSAMANHYWPGEEPLGRTIFLREYRKKVMADIVGVAGNVRQAGLRDESEDQMYFSYAQVQAPGSQTLIVRTGSDPQGFAGVIKREVRSVDRNQALFVLTTMDALLAGERGEPRFYMIILGAYGALALILTTLGLGGLVAFSVTRRTREIGLRISFGAPRAGLLRMFASGNLKLAAAGMAIGIPGSWAVTRYARTLLFEVTPADPATIGVVLALLAGVSIAVSVAAALRATTIEPADVLRHE